jgi:hypothetical protein
MNGHTWLPASLLDLAANPPAPPTIGGVVYPAKRTLISGETESLKTWFALILSKAEMDAGYSVAWADLDAMGSAELLARLQALGVADDVIGKRFLYYEPAERLINHVLEDVTGDIIERGIRLFVIDAFNPMLSLHGLDPNSTPDIETFWREVADPICRAGAAPTLLDHVAKNAGASKYAYGSERKASGAIVHIGTRLLHPLTRGGEGRTLLARLKDRPGYLPHPNIGRLILDSNGDTIAYRLEADISHSDGRFRPTGYMERISMKLELLDETVSQKWIEDNVTGQGKYLRAALDVLTDEGYIARTKDGKGYRIESVRPYREDDDTAEFDPDESSCQTSSLPRLDLVPKLTSTPILDLVSSSPPKETRDEDEADLVSGARPHSVGDAVMADLPDDAPEWERAYWKRRAASGRSA